MGNHALYNFVDSDAQEEGAFYHAEQSSNSSHLRSTEDFRLRSTPLTPDHPSTSSPPSGTNKTLERTHSIDDRLREAIRHTDSKSLSRFKTFEDAIKDSNQSEVKRLLTQGQENESLYRYNEQGFTPVHTALMYADEKTAELVVGGVPYGHPSLSAAALRPSGIAPLDLATMRFSTVLAKQLFKRGALFEKHMSMPADDRATDLCEAFERAADQKPIALSLGAYYPFPKDRTQALASGEITRFLHSKDHQHIPKAGRPATLWKRYMTSGAKDELHSSIERYREAIPKETADTLCDYLASYESCKEMTVLMRKKLEEQKRDARGSRSFNSRIFSSDLTPCDFKLESREELLRLQEGGEKDRDSSGGFLSRIASSFSSCGRSI